MLILHGNLVMVNSASVRCMWKRFASTFAARRSIMRRKIFNANTVGFVKRMENHSTKDMRGIELHMHDSRYVPPLQGGWIDLFIFLGLHPRLSHRGLSARGPHALKIK